MSLIKKNHKNSFKSEKKAMNRATETQKTIIAIQIPFETDNKNKSTAANPDRPIIYIN